MTQNWFFCGIGGSGMGPLALYLVAQGYEVSGSDRSHDQGKTPEKFAALVKAGIRLYPQDGSGIVEACDTLVVSSAVEPAIPDIRRALEMGIPILRRAELLAKIFNGSRTGIAVAGTSGKSTVTGMIATILTGAGQDPFFINGGIVKNTGQAYRIGQSDIFVTETDESDGSIALFEPSIAVLNNIELDHKSMEDLNQLFGDFIGRARAGIVINLDNENLSRLKPDAAAPIRTYSVQQETADACAKNIVLHPASSSFELNGVTVTLKVPGLHNISNALAALSVADMLGVEPAMAAHALADFTGIKRRFDIVGTRGGITVIDDFGHNPDKIAATLRTLKQFGGRVIAIFQPHGYGPLKLMGREMADIFSRLLGPDDILLMPEVYYAGGTADTNVTSKHVIEWAQEKSVNAHAFKSREEILPWLKNQAKEGDRIIVMGARDDSLSDFAQAILDQF